MLTILITTNYFLILVAIVLEKNSMERIHITILLLEYRRVNDNTISGCDNNDVLYVYLYRRR